MNRFFAAAAALAAGVAIAAPTAWSADSPAATTPAAPAPEEHHMPGMMGQGMRPMMGGPGGMHRMMMHRMEGLAPRQRCAERLARRAGMNAYTIAKLDLTPPQRPLWDKLQGILQTVADRERQLCAQLKPAAERSQETILDRVDRREQFLSARLDGLKQVRPALEQFYQALTADQKAIVNHPFRH